MKKFLPILIALGVLVVIGAGFTFWGVGKYNKLIAQGQNVDKSWGQVENVLQRRNDLIPNLVNVVQAYAVQEQEVFIKVAAARSLWAKAVQGGTIADKIKADTAIKGALLNVMAVAEQYPDLKSNVNFLALQDELAGTENRIAVERMRYNEAVQSYNTFAKSFPTNIFVSAFSFPKERDYFKAEEGAAAVPAVKFTYPGVAVPGVPQQEAPIQAAPFPTAQVPAAPAGEMQAMPAPQIAPPAAAQQPAAPTAPIALPAAPATPMPATSASPSTPTPPATASPGAPLTPTTPAQPAPGTPLAPTKPEPATPGTALSPTPPAPAAPSAPLSPTPAAAPTPGAALAPTTPPPATPDAPLTPTKPNPTSPSVETAPQIPTLPAAPVVKTPPAEATAPAVPAQ